jgi:hypothetical protein
MRPGIAMSGAPVLQARISRNTCASYLSLTSSGRNNESAKQYFFADLETSSGVYLRLIAFWLGQRDNTLYQPSQDWIDLADSELM